MTKRKLAASNLLNQYWYFFIILFCLSCREKSVDNGNYSEKFSKILKQTDSLTGKSKFIKGLNFLDAAYLKISDPTTNDRFRYYSYHYIYQQREKRNYAKALLYADSMLAIAIKSVNTKQYAVNFAEANFARGDAFFEMKQYNDAYQSYYLGYITGKNYVNNTALGDYTYRMGMIMYKKKRFNLAAQFFKDSYKYTNGPLDFASFYRKQELLDNIALSYGNNNQPDSALLYYDKALNFININSYSFPDRKIQLDMARGVVYGNKAVIYIQKKGYYTAIDLLKKSIGINVQKGYVINDAELAEIKLGQLYLDMRQSDSLINLLGRLRDQLDTVKNIEAEADYNRLMGNYYVNKANLNSAITYIQRYNQLKDSIAANASLLMETDINQQQFIYEKQHQIEQLNNANNLKVVYLYVTTIAAVMAVIMISLVYRNWRLSKHDVTTAKRLNGQINEQNHILAQALNELKYSGQEKDRILRAVAHDLRNPIGGIASLTAIMAQDDYTEDQKELINLVRETSLSSLELINEILEATNIGFATFNTETVEINSLVNNSIELLRFSAAEKRQTIIYEPLQNQFNINICKEKIWRVISNLISNAIKFSPAGQNILVKVEEQHEQMVISVKDNGIGIPANLKDQIFNMFTSAQRFGTQGEKSFGLGLSICKQIMEKHNGNIWFESNVGDGCTFFISLPYKSIAVTTNLAQKGCVPVA